MPSNLQKGSTSFEAARYAQKHYTEVTENHLIYSF